MDKPVMRQDPQNSRHERDGSTMTYSVDWHCQGAYGHSPPDNVTGTLGPIAQLGERSVCSAEVAGSTPARSTGNDCE